MLKVQERERVDMVEMKCLSICDVRRRDRVRNLLERADMGVLR